MRWCSEYCFKRHLHLKDDSELIFGKGVLSFMIWLSQIIQYRIWPPRPSLEYLLTYKIFSGFPSLDKAAKDFTGPVSQQLVPDSLLRLEAMQINFHIFQGSCISKSSILGGQDKTIFNRKSSEVRREKTSIVFDKLDISNEEDFCHRLYIFFYCNLNPNSGLRHCIKSSLIAL